jgi:hypothetical protein
VSPLALALVLAAAAFAVMHGVALSVRWLLWRRRPGTRSVSVLFALAVSPTLVPAAIAFGVLLPSFLLHEPARGDEYPAVLLWTLAAAGMARLAIVAGRAARMLYRSHVLVRRWARHACLLPQERWGLRALAVDLGHPEVALAGILRPRLFVDRRILEACSTPELHAIAAHERAHASSHDNLRRLLVEACNGRHSRIARVWRGAAETDADARAARSAGCAVDLAAALVRVSRLMTAHASHAAPLSAVHDGGDVQARVRRLLAAQAHVATTWLRTGTAVGLAAMALAFTMSRRTHAVLEHLLHLLP